MRARPTHATTPACLPRFRPSHSQLRRICPPASIDSSAVSLAYERICGTAALRRCGAAALQRSRGWSGGCGTEVPAPRLAVEKGGDMTDPDVSDITRDNANLLSFGFG